MSTVYVSTLGAAEVYSKSMETALIPYAAPTYSTLKLKMLSDMTLMSKRFISSSDRDFQNALLKEVSLSLTSHTEKLCGC